MADLQKKSAQLITEFRKSTVSMAGINYEQTDTMTIRAYGEQTGYSQCISSVGITLAAGTYYLSYKSTNPSSKFKPQLRSSNGATTYVAADGSFTLSEETTVYPRFVTLGTYTVPINEWLNIMLNEGSTRLPYEPYSATGWLHSLRKLTTATEAVENPLYSDGTAITAYTIKGNEEHTGTPSPQNPVMPNGVGVRTENLFDLASWYNEVNANQCTKSQLPNGIMITATGSDARVGDAFTSSIGGTIPDYRQAQLLKVKSNTDYVLKLSSSPKCYITYAAADYTVLNDEYIKLPVGDTAIDYQFTTPNNCAYILLRLGKDGMTVGETHSFTNIMLSEGSTAKPFEPYGYKIPIPSGGVTTNIYLGSTQTVRQIKKLVFTGEEDWQESNGVYYLMTVSDYLRTNSNITYMCTHYQAQTPITIASQLQNNMFSVNPSNQYPRLYFKDTAQADRPAFKAFLSQQYANGTPVTVWYVLATAETAAVNEPLQKIGTYADTLSNAVSIPTTEGANSISVDTTVQPSEFTATWTGWHNASVKEYDGSDWN